MTSSWHLLRTQLQENLRLRLGVWMILFVLVLYLALLLKDRNSELQDQYLEYTDKLNRLEEVADGKKWQERAQSARNMWADELKHFPSVESQGVARAGIENSLRAMLSKIGVIKPRVEIDQFRALSNLPGIMQLTAKIEGVFVPEQLVALLYELENQDQRGQVAKLQIARGSNSTFELTYVFYFQADTQPDTKKGEQGGS